MVGGMASRSCGCACRVVCAVGQKMPKTEKGKGEEGHFQRTHWLSTSWQGFSGHSGCSVKDILCLPMLLLVLPQVSYRCKHGYNGAWVLGAACGSPVFAVSPFAFWVR